jgi:hypothetical protein
MINLNPSKSIMKKYLFLACCLYIFSSAASASYYRLIRIINNSDDGINLTITNIVKLVNTPQVGSNMAIAPNSFIELSAQLPRNHNKGDVYFSLNNGDSCKIQISGNRLSDVVKVRECTGSLVHLNKSNIEPFSSYFEYLGGKLDVFDVKMFK